MRDECEHGSLRRSCGYCERDDMIKDAHDALRHIIATANQSRTQSRRLRWIAVRAQDGLDGTTEHQRVDLPKSASQSEVRLRIKCVKLKARIAELEAALAPFADAADHIPEEAEMLDVDYMIDSKVESESVAFEGIAFHRARALLQEES